MLTVHNIKVSATLPATSLDNVIRHLTTQKIPLKQYSNYISFKLQHTYVIFRSGKKDTNHINITQIKSVPQISTAIADLEKCLNQPVTFLQIDNIIATCQTPTNLILEDIVSGQLFESIKYNNEIFPGLFVKFPQGTIIIFHSGKIVFVGFKNLDDLKWISSIVLAHISITQKTCEKEQMSA